MPAPPTVLQLCPFSAYLESGLNSRFSVVRWFEMAPPAQTAWLAGHAGEVRGVATGGHVGCSNELMRALPELALIAINGVGVDKVDLQLARQRNVRVSTTPGVLTEDVADLAVGLVIGLLRGLAQADAFVRAGSWAGGERPLGRKVSGRRFGILGLGQIGRAIAARLSAFGPVAYSGPARKTVPYTYFADAASLAAASDVLVIACPANASTYHLVNAEVLAGLGPDGYLVNVARGAIVDEVALLAALARGELAGAALDVFANEPHVPEALRSSERVLLTPHVASATVESRTAMADMVLGNLATLLAPG
ncbi:MAG TPA: 2-hydroxyacid dehydrogenase [Steroidobacteraceae bacterium]|nr:2-hydroxyacid dehydrogenase [Steroidobacteraceae bacterium]